MATPRRSSSTSDANGVENRRGGLREPYASGIRLLDEASAYVERLLVENERAMTQMVETGARLAKVKTDRSEASI